MLLDIIAKHPHVDAAEIYRYARKKNPRIGLATVYRTLRLLEEIDLIEASGLGEGHSHYEIRDEDHVHIVCTECGRIVDVPSPVDLDALGASHGFRVQQTHVEIVGLCDDCARKARPSPHTDAPSTP